MIVTETERSQNGEGNFLDMETSLPSILMFKTNFTE